MCTGTYGMWHDSGQEFLLSQVCDTKFEIIITLYLLDIGNNMERRCNWCELEVCIFTQLEADVMALVY